LATNAGYNSGWLNVVLFCCSFLVGWFFLLGRVGVEFFAGLIQVLYLALLIPLLLLCSVFSTPFGIDAALVASLVEFSAETTPAGTFRVISLRAPTAHGLWHSLPYSDPEALNAIVEWINERI